MKSELLLLTYNNSWKEEACFFPLESGSISRGEMTVDVSPLSFPFPGRRIRALFRAAAPEQRISLALSFAFPQWRPEEDYLLVPAAVYDANRFRIKKIPYAPMFFPEDYGKQVPVTTTDIPHFSTGNGTSAISLRAGDGSVPAVFLYFPGEHKGMAFLYPCQGEDGAENGCVLLEDRGESSASLALRIMAPAVRSRGMYRFLDIRCDAPCEDQPTSLQPGETLSIQADCHEFPCHSLAEFYQAVYQLTHVEDPVAGRRSLPNRVPFSHGFHLVEDKYNRYTWHPRYGFYCVGENENLYSCWQTGWVGGINAAWPLYANGSEVTRRRALSTMDFLFRHMQAPSGFFYGISDGERLYGDDFADIGRKEVSLVRKSADALYFSACILLEMRKRRETPDPVWVQGLGRCADAFCCLFHREGQLGQFLDVEAGNILVGCSASGGMASAGLALCSLYFDRKDYLESAMKLSEYYYSNYTRIGLANGGPGEILSAPDSESAYALLENYVVLYECTKDSHFLGYAREAAALYATWCMPYDYPFPAQSVFGEADMRTTGAVWANVQNKHGAPGPCTHSGSALFRLSRYTGEGSYMELCRATSHNITQYLSRDDRPLWDYAREKAAPSGFMCERVSTCDWEGYDKIGGIYASGCWCEATLLCIATDIPGIWLDRKRNRLWVIDHVECAYCQDRLFLKNNTPYPARVNVLIDNGEWENGRFDYRAQFRQVELAPGKECEIEIPK